MTGATLYERQRVLTTLGVLEATPGRGPGSGVPLTPDAVAAVIISLLATDSLSEVDQRVVALCNAVPGDPVGIHKDLWRSKGSPTFKTEIGRFLSGQPLAHTTGRYREPVSIRVTRFWRAQITFGGLSGRSRVQMFFLQKGGEDPSPINRTGEIEGAFLYLLRDFTVAALKQLDKEDEE
jgi:hypothetical protein